MAVNWFCCLRFFLILGLFDLSSPSHLRRFVEKGEQKNGKNPVCVCVSQWVGTGGRRGKIHISDLSNIGFYFSERGMVPYALVQRGYSVPVEN